MNESKHNLKKSYKQFNKIVTISLLAGILVISSFLIFLIINPEPGFITFSVLNEEQKMQSYPTNATIGENISFYAAVDNHLGKDLTFNVKILKGDNNTIINETGCYDALLNSTIGNYTLNDKQFWISEQLKITFYSIGLRIIILELCVVPQFGIENFYDVLTLHLNITS